MTVSPPQWWSVSQAFVVISSTNGRTKALTTARKPPAGDQGGPVAGENTDEQTTLKRRVAALKEENDILVKAAKYLARELP